MDAMAANINKAIRLHYKAAPEKLSIDGKNAVDVQKKNRFFQNVYWKVNSAQKKYAVNFNLNKNGIFDNGNTPNVS